MNYGKMLKQTIKLNLDQYFLYIFSLIISVIFFFTELTLYNSYVVVINQKNIFVLPAIAVFNTALWSILTYISFVKHRQKEFATFLALGMTCNELKILLLLENILNFLIYVPIGLILGIIFSKIIVLFIFKLAGISAFTFKFKSIIYIITIGHYILLTIIFILWTSKFISSLSLLKIANYKNSHMVHSKKDKLLKIAPYILMLFCIHFNERMALNLQSRYYINYSLICIVVIFILFLIFINIFIVFAKKSKNFYYKRIFLINELEDSLKDNKIIIFFIAFLNFTFIISERIANLTSVKTRFNTYNIFQMSSFNTIYIFIVLLSFIASSTILYFKIKIDLDNWQFERIKLYNIGLIDEEIDSILQCKLRLIFFSHIFITTLASIVYLYICKLGKDFTINTIKIFICYFIIQSLGYIVTRIKVIETNR
ncbi:FtsX-like permease family protein [Clostridium estertheticum]|uniref:FtsX-like permease family protein n=2 Tax=Clostridium estertheticum TaxID=238834 RepID=UPI001C0CC4F2|nr:FtsX-like permease family protein [Clostridium estertheticum]MBU3199890.1 FtsX-like permease family protein [Clostridium estertheticum]WAG67011.1 FtsX-like permease family protein [Clostridium estertheticum]